MFKVVLSLLSLIFFIMDVCIGLWYYSRGEYARAAFWIALAIFVESSSPDV